MKVFPILLCVLMCVSSLVSSLPIISKPLENNPDHLVWETLLTIDTHRSDDKTRKIPKSIFITPNLNESKGNCPPDHKLGPDGRCYKTLKIDPLVILKTQIESLLKKNRTATTEYDEDYDYSEYGESTESMNSNSQYTVPLSLGFGNDHRPIHLQQQQLQHERRQQQQQQSQPFTTLPNLNRVVKDDSHIAPGLHVSSEKMNQPFLVSTTGLDLDSEADQTEDVAVESKSETSSSGFATASSLVPSSTKDATIETERSSTFGFIDDGSAATNPTTSFSNSDTTTTVHGLSQQTTIVSTNTEEIVSMDEQNTSKAATNTLKESLESTTAPMANTSDDKIAPTEQDHTDSSENVPTTTNGSEWHTADTLTINGTTTAAAASTTMPNDEIDSTMTSTQNDKAIDLTQSAGDKLAQSSTNTPFTMDSIEQQQQQKQLNASPKQLPTLSQTRGKLIEIDSMEKPLNRMTDVIDTLNPKLDDKNGDDDDDEVHQTTKIPISSTTALAPIDNSMANETNDSNDDLIDAIFIPSQFDTLTDEIDPAVGKTLNNSSDEPSKFHMENISTSAIVDAELPEAELAPVIDTGKLPRANFELIDNLDGTAHSHNRGASDDNDDDDEVKNLSARLADELLFLGINHTPPPSSPSTSFTSLPNAKNDTPSLPQPTTIHDKSKSLFEETLNGAPALGIGLSGEVTTEESIDYEANMNGKSVGNLANSDETSKNSDYDNVSSEKAAMPPVVAEKQTQTLVPPSMPTIEQQQQQNQQKPSIYSTFMNRLKYAPPLVDLSVDSNRPKSTIDSHNPFDLASVIQNANEKNVNTNERSAPSQPTFTINDHPIAATLVDGNNPAVVDDDGDGGAGGGDDNVSNIESTGIIDLSSGGRGNTNRHQLQIGINCYLRNLGNKQQFIICDNA